MSASMTLDDLASRLNVVRWSGDHAFVFFCPAHDNHNTPAGSARLTRDGAAMVKCFTGCTTEKICAAIGIRVADLFPPRTGHGDDSGRTASSGARQNSPEARANGFLRDPVCTRYEIRDDHGEVVAVHVRIDGIDAETGEKRKRLHWETPDGKSGLGGRAVASLPLFGAEALRDLPDDSTIVIVEGEKACGSLIGRKIAAVGTACGAAVTPSDDSLQPLLRFKTIILWPDKDLADPRTGNRPGSAHMERINKALVRMGHTDVRWIEVPDAPEDGSDAADFEGGQTAIEELLRTATERQFQPAGSDPPAIGFPALQTFEDCEREAREDASRPEVVRGLLRRGEIAGLAAKKGVGKSTLLRTLAVCAAHGAPFLDQETIQTKVLYVDLEPGNKKERFEAFERLGWHGGDRWLTYLHSAPLAGQPGLWKWLEDTILKEDFGLVIVDTLFKLCLIERGNDYATGVYGLAPLERVCERTGCCFVVAHHSQRAEYLNPNVSASDLFLGTTSIAGSLAVAMAIRRRGGARVIFMDPPRYGKKIIDSEWVLTEDPNTGRVTVAGDWQDRNYKLSAYGPEILDHLSASPGERFSAKKLSEELGRHQGDMRAVLASLYKEGKVERDGKGKPRSPFIYSVNDAVPKSSRSIETEGRPVKNPKRQDSEEPFLTIVDTAAPASAGDELEPVALSKPEPESVDRDLVTRPWRRFGVELAPDLVALPGLPAAQGAQLTIVRPNSPAASAGFVCNDIILAINGTPLFNRRPQDFVSLLEYHEIGDRVPIIIFRNGQKLTIEFEVC